jgi:CRISPR system Cascade subunit CasE
MHYISSFRLTRTQPHVRRLLSDCHALHVAVMRAFPPHPAGRAGHQVLFRTEERGLQAHLTVRSATLPDWGFLDPQWLASPVIVQPFDVAAIAVAGARVGLRLRGNPTVARMPQESEGEARNANGGVMTRVRGRRTPARDVASVTAWFTRRLARAGLAIEAQDLTLTPERRVCGARVRADEPRATRRPDLTFDAVEAAATGTVVDAAAFAQALVEGMGSGKAYGFGLLDAARL